MILLCGDIHGNTGHILPAVIAEKASAVILLGDIQAQLPLHEELKEVMQHTEVYWIPGNHDNDSKEDYANLFESELADRNLHGRIVEIDGLKVGGLGGIFREHIWRPVPVTAEPVHLSYEAFEEDLKYQYRYGKISKQKRINELSKHKTTIFYEDWAKLYGYEADILVTHEAPSCHPFGYESIDVLARSMKVKQTFHAHHHDRLNYSAYSEILGFEAHGVGFRGVTNQRGDIILEGDFDQKRMWRQSKI